MTTTLFGATTMIEQPQLPLRPYADRHVPRVKGSDTSTAAAISQEPSLASTQYKILSIIRYYATSGCTDDELEGVTGLRHQSVSARRRELVLAGLVVDSGERRLTSSGRMATVWKAMP